MLVPDFPRYQRQMILPGVGSAGQQRLAEARVLCIGMGGLGSPVTTYLALAGIGTLGLADNDVVEASNLHRQFLHTPDQLGRAKVLSARDRLLALNPDLRIELHPQGISPDNALQVFSGYDLIIDGSDNFPTRFLSNDAAFLCRKPLVYGSIFQFEGQVSLFHAAAGGPCYRCLFPQPPPQGAVPNCAEAGVIGPVCGIVGSWQAMTAVQFLLGLGNPLIGRMKRIDCLAATDRLVAIKPDPACPLCGSSTEIRSIDPDRYQFQSCIFASTTMPANANPTQSAELPLQISVTAAAARLSDSAEPPFLLDVREHDEFAFCHLPNARLIPLQQLPDCADSLPRDRDLIVYCHHGGRSLRAVRFLRQKGFSRAQNLEGGINAWSLRVDPTVPRY